MKKRKQLKWLYALFILSALFIGLLLWPNTEQQVEINRSDKSRHMQWVEDLAYFENEYLPNSRTLSKDAVTDCKVLVERLKENIDVLSDNQIILELSKCVAMANNGHTTIHLSGMDKIPLRFYWFEDGLYVIKADTAFSEHLGSKVLRINSIAIDSVQQMLNPYLAGTTAFKKFISSNYLNSPEILNGIGLSNSDSLNLSLLKEGDTLNVKFGTKEMPNTKYEYETWADLYPDTTESASWSHVLSKNDELPLYLENMKNGVFYTFMNTEKVAYFSINALWYRCEDFEDKIDKFLESLETKNDYDVVIDLRYYTGGNYVIPTELATEPPKLIDDNKKIYLITSNMTFSAGLVTAARIKRFAEDKIVVVGEEVGDNLKFWAEGDAYKLPYSGIEIQDSKYEHDWAENSFTLGKTFWVNAFYGVAAKDLSVNKKIRLGFEDYKNNTDPILNWILENKD